MRMEFPDSRSAIGWLLLILGLLGIAGIFSLFSGLEVSSYTEPKNNFIEGLFLKAFVATSCINKIFCVKQRINGWLLLISIITPILSLIAGAVITTQSSSVVTSDITIATVFWSLTILIWIITWWVADIIDFIRYGRKTL